jgi:predicted Zn-ribbon and HTH transcriptional regulator
MQTTRKQMIGLLEKEEMSARELSQAVRIREKEVYEHLAHIGRTVNTKRKKLVITPSQCFECGYVFKNRKRYTRPGRCPHCKSERISNPTYRILSF